MILLLITLVFLEIVYESFFFTYFSILILSILCLVHRLRIQSIITLLYLRCSICAKHSLMTILKKQMMIQVMRMPRSIMIRFLIVVQLIEFVYLFVMDSYIVSSWSSPDCRCLVWPRCCKYLQHRTTAFCVGEWSVCCWTRRCYFSCVPIQRS